MDTCVPDLRNNTSVAVWKWGIILLFCAWTFLIAGCADDAFLPPPENPPPGQSHYEAPEPQPLQPPPDL